MQAYDRSKPLIVIHVPKTAGTSCREVFKGWFEDNLHFHYADMRTGALPRKIDLEALHSPARPVALYGHFNRLQGFGVEDYYPQVSQFVSILRDPLELSISAYYFFKAYLESRKGDDRISVPGLEEHLETVTPNMLNHFPRELTHSNFRELIDTYFIEIGITERLDESLARIAEKLGFQYHGDAPRLNIGNQTHSVSSSTRELFMRRNSLEYEVYYYVLSRYD